ncbi:PaaI family thioesterase [Halieaceae bacterium IMCC14734]|uniref:PaaI family thioesterase n=1 Tax=Candidatus Litorirhabdus singularis TaxID=2518993 RepID=A0ABT3TE45_9GAMM|nr:PaaI family thioesterase [Candidatus Litorirhabdus singularis]MCX2980460.1 PaaI family thioesterase [Candidatus Litorirhabdus singularis]
MTEHDDFLSNFPPEPSGYRLPPAGFTPHLSAGGFSRHNGPFYQKLVGQENYRGFYVLERHCNSMGIAHGGLLVSFVDALLGLAVYRVTRQAPITVRLTTDFTASAKLGEWVEGKAHVIEVADDVIFVSALVYSGDTSVLAAQGVFKAQSRNMQG